jgi:hypothetical protein
MLAIEVGSSGRKMMNVEDEKEHQKEIELNDEGME